jgi:hypothetical protein
MIDLDISKITLRDLGENGFLRKMKNLNFSPQKGTYATE